MSTEAFDDEADLFGSESEHGDNQQETQQDNLDNLDETDLFGSDNEGEGNADYDEEALFGSDDEGGAEGAAAAPAAAGARAPADGTAPPTPRSPARSEMSELNENEIFGEVSDDEPEKVEDVRIRERKKPESDRVFIGMRLPNILSVERAAYNPETLPQKMMEGYSEFTNTLRKQSTRLLNPENCVRWRFKRDSEGTPIMDSDGRPQYESNGRIVEWEDGSRTLYVGNECFHLSEMNVNLGIFEENTQDVHVCHGTMKRRLIVTPWSLETKSHDMLKRSQFQTFEANRRSLLQSAEERAAKDQIMEIRDEQTQKQSRRSDVEKKRQERGKAHITADFLDNDDSGEEEALLPASDTASASTKRDAGALEEGSPAAKRARTSP